MSENERRLRLVELTGEFITGIFEEGNVVHSRITKGLPSDAEFRRIEYDRWDDTYLLIVWSSEFETVPEASEIPELVIEFKDLRAENELTA